MNGKIVTVENIEIECILLCNYKIINNSHLFYVKLHQIHAIISASVESSCNPSILHYKELHDFSQNQLHFYNFTQSIVYWTNYFVDPF
jgi:hypothetical protein